MDTSGVLNQSNHSLEWLDPSPPLPDIGDDDPFPEVAHKFSDHLIQAIQVPHTYEQLRTIAHGRSLSPLIRYLTENCHNIYIVSALL